MTPEKLLEAAKSQFLVLYHNDETALGKLLRSSLGTFQDRAGAFREMAFEAGATELPFPDHFLYVVNVLDKRGNFLTWIENDTTISLVMQPRSVAPFKLTYGLNLRDWPVDRDLPGEVISLTLEHLISAIELPNTQRARKAAVATGQQVEFPSDETLLNKKMLIEQAMEDSMMMLPMMTVRV